MKILFVCLGNICRSPMAEGILKKMCINNNLSWTVHSAGTNSYHTGEPPHMFSQAICKENGIDISAQRAKRFVKNTIDDYDIIYALATDVYDEIEEIAGVKMNKNKVKLFLDVLYPNQQKSVTDPWYGGKEGYYPVFEEIKNGCEAIIQNTIS